MKKLPAILAAVAMLLSTATLSFAAECEKVPYTPANGSTTVEVYEGAALEKIKTIPGFPLQAMAADKMVIVLDQKDADGDRFGHMYYLAKECVVYKTPGYDSGIEKVFNYYGIGRDKQA